MTMDHLFILVRRRPGILAFPKYKTAAIDLVNEWGFIMGAGGISGRPIYACAVARDGRLVAETGDAGLGQLKIALAGGYEALWAGAVESGGA